jgi:hypothetical protein
MKNEERPKKKPGDAHAKAPPVAARRNMAANARVDTEESDSGSSLDISLALALGGSLARL